MVYTVNWLCSSFFVHIGTFPWQFFCLHDATDGRARKENVDKGIGGGMVWHFDGRVVYVCFCKVVTDEWNTEGVFFLSLLPLAM
jgi:hypothetical protein